MANHRLFGLGMTILVFGTLFFGGSGAFYTYLFVFGAFDPSTIFGIATMFFCLLVCWVVGSVAVYKSRVWASNSYQGGYVRASQRGANTSVGVETLSEYLGPTLVDKSGGKHATGDLGGKHVGFLISAAWGDSNCFETQRRLVELYQVVNSRSIVPSFEIVYVSADRTKEEFEKAMQHFPFLALPFEDVVRRKRYRKRVCFFPPDVSHNFFSP